MPFRRAIEVPSHIWPLCFKLPLPTPSSYVLCNHLTAQPALLLEFALVPCSANSYSLLSEKVLQSRSHSHQARSLRCVPNPPSSPKIAGLVGGVLVVWYGNASSRRG